MIDLFLSIGYPLIDQSLDKLLQHMVNPPTNYLFSQMLAMARSIGTSLAIGVGAYEAWMMILGRRGMDVMKLLRIFGLALCITFSGIICKTLRTPGLSLERSTHFMALVQNKRLDQMQIKVALKQKEYLDSLRSKQAQQEEQKAAQDAATEDGIMDKIKNAIDNLGLSIQNQAKQVAVIVETKASEFANMIIRFIGEIIFQMMYYGMFIAQRVFMSVMALFCPIVFAMSIAPPWRNAWSQWVSKYVTLSLWGFIIYLVVYYIDYLLWCTMQSDIKAYDELIKGKNINTGDSIGAFGFQALGTTCMYVVGCLAGAKILGMVPEVASWLIPGGVSSSAGSTVSGLAGGAVGFALGKSSQPAGSVISTTASRTASTATGMVNGGYQGARSGAQMGASVPGGPVARGIGATVGAIGGATLGAVGGGLRGAFTGNGGFKKSDDDSSSSRSSGGGSNGSAPSSAGSSSIGGSEGSSSSGGSEGSVPGATDDSSSGANKSDDDNSTDSGSGGGGNGFFSNLFGGHSDREGPKWPQQHSTDPD